MDNRPHIVVVEDEVTQRDMLVDYLSRHQFRVNGVENGRRCATWSTASCRALSCSMSGLPGEDGFALARWLRERSGRIGIIMVTAASDTVDRVVGLETGADDYIAKPFEPRELLARVKSVLRRAVGSGTTPSNCHSGAHGPPCARPRTARFMHAGQRYRRQIVGQRVRPTQGVRGKPKPAFDAGLAARGNRASRNGSVRPIDRPAHYEAAPEDRGRSGSSRGNPHRARGRLHVCAAEGLSPVVSPGALG